VLMLGLGLIITLFILGIRWAKRRLKRQKNGTT
jgi:hypothetical protein